MTYFVDANKNMYRYTGEMQVVFPRNTKVTTFSHMLCKNNLKTFFELSASDYRLYQMYKLKFLIILSVFQVSSTLNITYLKKVLHNEVFKNRAAYKLVAFSAEYLPDLLDPFGDERQSLISDARWYIKKSFNAENDVSFYLYTKRALDRREELRLHDSQSLRASRFNALHPTRIIIHGWLGSEYAGVFFSVTPAYLRTGNYNIILVDWGKGAIADYTTASKRVKSVGVVLARFVDFLHQQSGAQFESIHFVGFSMGAHVAGIAGKFVKGGRIPVIFGLDPALPMFSFKNTDGRLTYNDANYVEVIHTNAGGYGYEKAIGHSDFYVNYGSYQPGCILSECSHFRAFKVFAESITTKTGFWARGCDPRIVDDLLRNRRCEYPTGVSVLLGGNLTHTKLKGVFYLETNYEAPYAVSNISNK